MPRSPRKSPSSPRKKVEDVNGRGYDRPWAVHSKGAGASSSKKLMLDEAVATTTPPPPETELSERDARKAYRAAHTTVLGPTGADMQAQLDAFKSQIVANEAAVEDRKLLAPSTAAAARHMAGRERQQEQEELKGIANRMMGGGSATDRRRRGGGKKKRGANLEQIGFLDRPEPSSLRPAASPPPKVGGPQLSAENVPRQWNPQRGTHPGVHVGARYIPQDLPLQNLHHGKVDDERAWKVNRGIAKHTHNLAHRTVDTTGFKTGGVVDLVRVGIRDADRGGPVPSTAYSKLGGCPVRAARVFHTRPATPSVLHCAHPRAATPSSVLRMLPPKSKGVGGCMESKHNTFHHHVYNQMRHHRIESDAVKEGQHHGPSNTHRHHLKADLQEKEAQKQAAGVPSAFIGKGTVTRGGTHGLKTTARRVGGGGEDTPEPENDEEDELDEDGVSDRGVLQLLEVRPGEFKTKYPKGHNSMHKTFSLDLVVVTHRELQRTWQEKAAAANWKRKNRKTSDDVMHVTDLKERNDLANSVVSDAIHAQVTHHNDTINVNGVRYKPVPDTDGTTRKAHVKKMLLENDSQIRRKEAVKLRRFGGKLRGRKRQRKWRSCMRSKIMTMTPDTVLN